MIAFEALEPTIPVPVIRAVSEKIRVFSYFCIVNTPGRPGYEISVLSARDDTSAKKAMVDLADQWPGYETICMYQGERPVAVLGNPQMGLAIDGLIDLGPEFPMAA